MKLKVSFRNVSKQYVLYKKQSDKIKGLFFPNKNEKGFFAVRDVSFDVYEGETIGFVGINGSGKSTMSNLLAKIIPPTSGEIDMDGQPSLIAIAAGLNNQLSGKDNIRLKCLMMGLTNKEIDELYEKIVEFADIGDFIDQPVKSYSSGMKSRLGFAISAHIDPDILIIDEALSVGDQTFYQKCVDRITEFKEQGKTIFFVSHSISQIQKICDRVAWMHYGELRMFDDTNKVVKEYKEFVDWFNKLSKKEKQKYQMEHKEGRKGVQKTEKVTRYKESGKRRSFFGPAFQVTIIAVLTILLALSMFSDRPLRTLATFGAIPSDQTETSHTKNPQTKGAPDMKKVDRQAIVTADSLAVYKDQAMKKKADVTLPFGQEVQAVAENKQTVQIKTASETYFVKPDGLQHAEELKSLSIGPGQFNSYVSPASAGSYEYLLSFLGKEESVLKQRMQTLSSIKSEQGAAIERLTTEKTDYVIQNGQANTMVFREIMLISPSTLGLTEQNVWMNEKQTKFAVKGENNLFVIDNEQHTLTISVIK
ncbi:MULTISPECIES: teichoic acids export ABC transporter ATP-binding subunit TagH [unclassified Bacillus (in: firmicutes)]|uniref:teichoic acids export ABC transporter ATP-binding subunit TagH n=1 Tax=unclassified Bacillus (in: firmicutes) TaxID=185979 RepID=UPI000D03C64B|nr:MULTISPECIES: teichoic acids export ABC transporter ATP-binding subunit TagH [unclassified Bacillus (in: firmicutes)]PRR90518.1 teichoic acids export ABC transporter ATP-binding subunit TagH [Bacillus sp. NMCN1]PRR98295.1 teichoic acids export ABC transporter ATP-binding subunit TagH [Bacillus sp. NMCN6]